MSSIPERIAEELNVKTQQVIAAVELLDEGATVPFISRYRKEVTGGLDDTEMRTLEERLRYLREMEERRTTILGSIREQDKLTDELEAAILAADTKTRLEDLYLPYKPKRRTKGQIAIESGLEPLADSLLADPGQQPELLAESYFNKDHEINDVKAALDGAKFILMERFSQDANLIEKLRQYLQHDGLLSARVVDGKQKEGEKFRDYFEHDEALAKVPSHRLLAMLRGRNEGFIRLSIVVGDPDDKVSTHPAEVMVADFWKIEHRSRPADNWLREVVRWTWRIKLYTHLESDLLLQLRQQAEEEAINVFARNLKDLLLAAPAGPKVTIGLDPGLRTGVKVAVVDSTGKVLDHTAIYPTPPQKKIKESAAVLAALASKHQCELVAIGNGTASRETERFVGDLIKDNPELGLKKVMVNEAGASVYSASEYAAKEFPDLDVTIRGAISIARRLQDPLAELVKIEPKSIGVGQYQHDVSQSQLARSLDAVIEDCVNAVGVDINTASSALLSQVSGLNSFLAGNIVEFRNQHGSFASREQLKQVGRFGEKTFEQAAGFLRVANGDNPLDASAVHPESYSVVEAIAEKNQRNVKSLVGDSSFLKSIKAEDYTSEKFGLPTVKDIIIELVKPGRDPRPEFKTAEFKEGVEKLSDLVGDMVLEGTVTNVTNFGAFVDVGVHQDGLVHISVLSDTFVKDPHSVVKAGEIVKVKVMDVDIPRKRIALSMRMNDSASEHSNERGGNRDKQRSRSTRPAQSVRESKPASESFAGLFADAKQRKGKRL